MVFTRTISTFINTMLIHKEVKDRELYVYMNGKLIYKRWLDTGASKVFDVMAYNKNPNWREYAAQAKAWRTRDFVESDDRSRVPYPSYRGCILASAGDSYQFILLIVTAIPNRSRK